MRKGRREILAALGLRFLLGATPVAAPPDPFPGSGGKPVRVAVEISWADRTGGGDGAFELDMTEGRVVEALTWPGGERRGTGLRAGGTPDLGAEGTPGLGVGAGGSGPRVDRGAVGGEPEAPGGRPGEPVPGPRVDRGTS